MPWRMPASTAGRRMPGRRRSPPPPDGQSFPTRSSGALCPPRSCLGTSTPTTSTPRRTSAAPTVARATSPTGVGGSRPTLWASHGRSSAPTAGRSFPRTTSAPSTRRRWTSTATSGASWETARCFTTPSIRTRRIRCTRCTWTTATAWSTPRATSGSPSRTTATGACGGAPTAPWISSRGPMHSPMTPCMPTRPPFFWTGSPMSTRRWTGRRWRSWVSNTPTAAAVWAGFRGASGRTAPSAPWPGPMTASSTASRMTRSWSRSSARRPRAIAWRRGLPSRRSAGISRTTSCWRCCTALGTAGSTAIPGCTRMPWRRRPSPWTAPA